jgi:hypothetical protein
MAWSIGTTTPVLVTVLKPVCSDVMSYVPGWMKVIA